MGGVVRKSTKIMSACVSLLVVGVCYFGSFFVVCVWFGHGREPSSSEGGSSKEIELVCRVVAKR